MMVDRHPQAGIYSHRAIGLGRDELNGKFWFIWGNFDGIRYVLGLDESPFVKQHTGRLMPMQHRTSVYSTEDHSYDGDADPSDNPIPTDGLLFMLAVCIGGLYDRLFGGTVPDGDTVEPPEPDYPFGGYCGI